jgi:hypothetical protein
MAGTEDITSSLRRRRRESALVLRFWYQRARWVLRFRLRLQRGEYPPTPTLLPPLVNEPLPLLAAEQVRVGRVFGRVYLWFDRAREHIRIERSRWPDRLSGPRLTLALFRQQLGLVANVLALIVIGGAADVVVTRYGSHLGSLPLGNFARQHLSGPSTGTLDSALAATATATGAVLGLVLTISLITFQATANRYRSDRIVSFLLREQVGTVVVRLLTIGFLYSLWMLFMRGVLPGYPPYVSTALAVLVTTAGIGSLIVYRLHALLGLAPGNVFLALEREMRRELSRLTRRRPGRSVESHARRIVLSDLEITKDLLSTLVAAGDWRAASMGAAGLGRLLDAYIPFKRRIPRSSQWFRQVPVRLGTDAYEITLNFARTGRLPPTDMRPENDWFEHEIYEAIALIPVEGLKEPALRDALFTLQGHVIQLAWAAHEWGVLTSALDGAESLATAPAVIESASREFLEVAWVAVHGISRGLTSSPTLIVETRPWEQREPLPLPAEAATLGAELGRKIRKEIAITGRVVTNFPAMIAELTPRWARLQAERQAQYLNRALEVGTKHLHAVVAAKSAPQAAIAAETTLRVILLAFAEGAKPTFRMDSLELDIAEAYQLAEPEARTQLREEGVWVALRTFAEGSELDISLKLLRLASALDVFDQMSSSTVEASGTAAEVAPDVRSAQQRFELLLQFAYVFGWAEFHQVDGVTERLAPMVSTLFPNTEELLRMFDTTSSVLVWPFTAGVKHRTWFQPLLQAIYELPEVPVFEEGAFGYDLERDHPSQIIREWRDFGDIDDLLKAMVEEIVSINTRRRLIELIDGHISELGG